MEDSIKQQAQRQFAKNAAKYVTSPGHTAGEDLAYLVSASGAEKHMDVLDIATGGGHTANALAPLVRSVIAYDLTEEMLAAAEAFITGNGRTNVSFGAMLKRCRFRCCFRYRHMQNRGASFSRCQSLCS